MDEQDKEFETFLKRFQLRQHAPFPAEVPVEASPRRHGRRWVLAAAAAAIVAVLSLPLARHFFLSPVSPAATVEAVGDSMYKAGQTIPAGTVIHSGGFEPLLIRLKDGTYVEMRAQAQVVLEPREDGAQVRLNNGSILVKAANQRDGHLYVKTNDTLVSVIGTLFLVESLPQGSRIAVLEGKVEVRWGAETQQLVKGQQASSSSEITFASIEELIAWSREFGSLKTLFVSELEGIAETPPPASAAPPRAPVQNQAHQQEPNQPAPQPRQEAPPQPAPSPERQPQSDAGRDDPGRQIFYRACVACHNDQIASSRQWPSRDAVESFVRFEISRGAPVSPPEVQPLVDYIYTNYGARSPNPPRTR